MKKISLLFAVSALLLTSCSLDSGSSEYTQTVAALADVYTDSKALPSYAIDDDDERIVFSNQPRVSWMTKADSCYRCLVYYDISSSSSQAELQSLTKILTLEPKTPEEAKKWSAIRDEVTFVSGWRTKRYINLNLTIDTGNSENTQTFGIVADSIVSKSFGDIHYLTLCHDQNSVPRSYSQTAYLSIPISDFSTSDSVYVNIPIQGGDKICKY